eukprot:16354-Heterococcus_DN1.PRE.3
MPLAVLREHIQKWQTNRMTLHYSKLVKGSQQAITAVAATTATASQCGCVHTHCTPHTLHLQVQAQRP